MLDFERFSVTWSPSTVIVSPCAASVAIEAMPFVVALSLLAAGSRAENDEEQDESESGAPH